MNEKPARMTGLILWSCLFGLATVSTACGQGYVRIQGDQFVCDGRVVKIKGTNYYPKNHMWAAMWSSWDWPEITAETQMMKKLGLNAARILVPYSNGGWGGAYPPPDRLQMLEDIVNHFGANGIRSCVTLFDWETSFPAAGTARETDHLRYLSAIVNRLRNNKHVFLWDVKNEPDHPANIGGYDNWDANPAARDKIVSWLARMCNAVRAIDVNHPVSAGLRWWENVEDVLGFVDVAIFHSYWPNISTQEIPDVKRYMGANARPILVEEYGWPSNPTPCNRDGRVIWDYNETAQLDLYVSHLAAFELHNIAGGIQWMTFDAKAYTSNANESFENYFGLWRFDYSLKPAGEHYRDRFFVAQFLGTLDATAPGAVASFAASCEPAQSQLTWQNPADADFVATMIRVGTTAFPASPSADKYVALRYAAPGSADACTLGGLTPGATYYLAAFARDYSGNWSPAAHAIATPGQDAIPPAPVTAFKASCLGTFVRLTWQNPVDRDFKGTVIRYGISAFPQTPTEGTLLADRPKAWGTTDAFDHTGLTPGVVYCYAAFSYDSASSPNYGIPATATGSRSGPADFDHDGDVDISDFALIQLCFNGPNRSPLYPGDCGRADLDNDADVDLEDFALYQHCFNGPNRLMPTECLAE